MRAIPISASPLPGEAEILGHVVSDLNDLARKLVYADWLDDHDDPQKNMRLYLVR